MKRKNSAIYIAFNLGKGRRICYKELKDKFDIGLTTFHNALNDVRLMFCDIYDYNSLIVYDRVNKYYYLDNESSKVLNYN